MQNLMSIKVLLGLIERGYTDEEIQKLVIGREWIETLTICRKAQRVNESGDYLVKDDLDYIIVKASPANFISEWIHNVNS